ncbi:hypothetical protein HMPREF1333_02331 [Enterococcus faecalis ERV37]|nr:hypothetical protein HMPREF1333_02331 [Enterococcus faecalis ERV37]
MLDRNLCLNVYKTRSMELQFLRGRRFLIFIFEMNTNEKEVS